MERKKEIWIDIMTELYRSRESMIIIIKWKYYKEEDRNMKNNAAVGMK